MPSTIGSTDRMSPGADAPRSVSLRLFVTVHVMSREVAAGIGRALVPGVLVRQLFDTESSTYTYLVADPVARVAALIDPVREQIDRDLELVRQLGLQLSHVFETHTSLRRRRGATRAAATATAIASASSTRRGS